ncbi:MAG: bifunctional DedA family/phosphatase PAP2 family protein [Rhizobiaceae bacterium]|nr:bifunctional DedA family/phosphatase PAP2 family protein [Rhizobiaceae bacterium]
MTSYLAPLVDFLGTHPGLAIGVVFLISLLEALFVVGLFMPSTVVLVGAGALIGSGTLSFWPIFLFTTLGAVVGDFMSYWIGHTYRERLKSIWPFSRYTFLIDSGQAFFARHGAKSIFIARFLPAIKSIVPGIAGMMGMNVKTFSIINTISAFAWAIVHLAPGIIAGRGLSRYWQANPRLVTLMALVLVGLLAFWYLTKLVLILILPRLNRLREHIISRGDQSQNRALRFAISILKNETGLVASMTWSIAIVGLLLGFVSILLNVLFDPQLSAADSAISSFVQSLRNSTADSIMVFVTMMGDSRVLTVLSLALIVWILFHRHWKIATSVTLAIASATLFVPLVKTLVHRARPTSLYTGAESFSFPSGHATHSAVIFGIIAVLLAHNLTMRVRLSVYFAALALIGSVALSRVYVGAHWPSDVLAGVMFGLSIVAALAFFLRNRTLHLQSPLMSAMLCFVFLAALAINYNQNAVKWTKAYAYRPIALSVPFDEWINGGWKTLPDRRVTFEGDSGEKLDIQTAVPIVELKTRLSQLGWNEDTFSPFSRFLETTLPSSRPLSDRATLARYNEGQAPVVVMTKAPANASAQRSVLRLWSTINQIGNQVDAEPDTTPIMVGSISTETLEPLAFGFAEIESMPRSEPVSILLPSLGTGTALTRKMTPTGTLLIYQRKDSQ